MKKLLVFTTVAALTMTLSFNSCKDDNPISCTQKAVDVSNAASDYGQDPSSANCLKYKNAINDYMDCDIVTAAQKEAYQAILAELDC